MLGGSGRSRGIWILYIYKEDGLWNEKGTSFLFFRYSLIIFQLLSQNFLQPVFTSSNPESCKEHLQPSLISIKFPFIHIICERKATPNNLKPSKKLNKTCKPTASPLAPAVQAAAPLPFPALYLHSSRSSLPNSRLYSAC